MDKKTAFIDRLGKAKKNSGLKREGYIVWGSSVIKGEDGRYHMFSSSWPDVEGASWITDSTIIRSVSDTPEGPFEFVSLALPPRGEGHWDGSMTHNPTIHKYKDTYVLFYTGTHYEDQGNIEKNHYEGLKNKRIGLARSKSVFGPWERLDQPIIQPREGKWDAIMTSNAAPYIEEDGSVLLVYKSWSVHAKEYKDGHVNQLIGVARAPHILGPYKRIREERIFNDYPIPFNTEDMYIWKQDGCYHMIAKVFFEKSIVGEINAGYYARSEDGIEWTIHDQPKAYSRTIEWDDGTSTTYEKAERGQLLIQDGIPTHLYLACLPEGRRELPRSICIPLNK